MFKAWPYTCLQGGSNGIPKIDCLPYVFANVVNAFLLFSGVVALFLIAYSGIRLILSGGDPKQITAARSMITYAIIGLIVVLMSFSVIFFIGYITRTTDCITNISNVLTGCK